MSTTLPQRRSDLRPLEKKDFITPARRLNSGMYQILSDQDEFGNPLPPGNHRAVQFRCNNAQVDFFNAMHTRNVLLKARQLGFSTFILLHMLDMALWNPGFRGAIIADTLEIAKALLKDKIDYPYDHLPAEVVRVVPGLVNRSKTELSWDNGSGIYAGVSFRGGTLNYLHVSEFGKVAITMPSKANEIMTGAAEAVGKAGIITVESTARGTTGQFYNLCNVSRRATATLGGDVKDPLNWHFHFFPWWQRPEYEVDPVGIPIQPRLVKYFEELKVKHGILLSAGQKAWYAQKEATHGHDMWREYPSTPEEAFKASVEGAYWQAKMLDAYAEGRITKVQHDPSRLVDTWWDIGRDMTSVWFTQTMETRLHVLKFIQDTNTQLEDWVKRVTDLGVERKWRWGRHVAPHDMGNTDWSQSGGKTRVGVAKDLGMTFEVLGRVERKNDSIEAGERMIPIAYFDAEECAEGIDCLMNYHKKWSTALEDFLDEPAHDKYCHGADAWQQLGMGHTFDVRVRDGSAYRQPVPLGDRPQGTVPSEAWT